jgi:hypothetical protein
MIVLLMQLRDLLLSIVNDLAQSRQLVLALVDDRVDVVLRLVLHLVHLRVQRVVVTSEPPPILPLHGSKEKVRAIGIIHMFPKSMAVGFDNCEGLTNLLKGEVDDAIGIGA